MSKFEWDREGKTRLIFAGRFNVKGDNYIFASVQWLAFQIIKVLLYLYCHWWNVFDSFLPFFRMLLCMFIKMIDCCCRTGSTCRYCKYGKITMEFNLCIRSFFVVLHFLNCAYQKIADICTLLNSSCLDVSNASAYVHFRALVYILGERSWYFCW
jgi:hypothetical protein